MNECTVRSGQARCQKWKVVGVAFVLLFVVTGIAACGSNSHIDKATDIRNAIESAGREVSFDLEAGRYEQACQRFTAKAQRQLAQLTKGGCVALLGFTRGIAVVASKPGSRQPHLGRVFQMELVRVLGHAQLERNVAIDRGRVIARLEDGGWRFESSKPEEGSSVLARSARVHIGASHSGEALTRLLSESGSSSANTPHK